MKHYILAATVVAISFATPALAESTYTRECHWEHGRYLCEAEYKSPYSTSKTECSFERGGPNKCETTMSRRPPAAEGLHTMAPPSGPRYMLIAPGSPDVQCIGPREACGNRR